MKDAYEAMKALQFPDPMKETREAMEALQFHGSTKGIQEAMKAFQFPDPMKDALETMKTFQFQDSMKAIRETMKAPQFPDPMKDALEIMKAFEFQDSMKGIRETMKALQFPDPMKGIREAMEAFQFHNSKGMQEAMKAFQFPDSMKDAQEAMKAFQLYNPMKGTGALQIESLAEAMSARSWPLAYENLDTDIVVHGENAISVGSTTLTHSEIQSLVDQIADKAFSPSEERLEQAVAVIIAEIASLRNSKLEILLTYLIFPIVVAFMFSIINPVIEYYVKEALSVNERQMKKDIRKHALASVDDSTQLNSYRFVSTKVLNVHLNPSAKSSVLGRFHLGQALLLIEKDEAWSLVAWHDDDGRVALQGWVFSRYLNKFR